MKLYDGGVYLVNENEIIADTSEAAAILQSKTGSVPAKEEAKTEPSEEEIAAKRLEMIKTYNEQNKGNSWIEDEKPTEEEVKAIAQEYKEKVEAFNAIKFTIADEANALRVAKFLKKWNEDSVCWENEGWRGAIFFDAIIIYHFLI